MAAAGAFGRIEVPVFAAGTFPPDRPRPFKRAPFKWMPFESLPFADLPLESLPFTGLPLALAYVLLPLSPCFCACFNFALSSSSALAASFAAFRSALALSRIRSALASARCFLRFFSQAPHLQPIGFRYALK